MKQPQRFPNETILPERWLWHVFGELVDACLILRQGHPDRAVPDWRPLVHNDLHSANVFLDDRKPEDEATFDQAVSVYVWF